MKKIEKMIEEKEESYNMDELIARIKRNDKKRIMQAKQEEKEKTLMDIIEKLVNLKMPLDQISEITGITEEKIKSFVN